MKHKIISATVLLIAISIGSLQAQKGRQNFADMSADELAKVKTEKMTEKLELNSDQQSAVLQVMLNTANKTKEVQAKYPELEQAKKEMLDLRKSTKSKVKNVLTEEQRELMRNSTKENKGPHMDETHQMDPLDRLNKMKTDLNLSEEQVTRLEVIFKEAKKQKKELKSRYPELDNARKEIKLIREESNLELKKILTPAQYEKYISHSKKHDKQKHHKRKGQE